MDIASERQNFFMDIASIVLFMDIASVIEIIVHAFLPTLTQGPRLKTKDKERLKVLASRTAHL